MGEEVGAFDAPQAGGLGRRAARGGAVVFASMALQKVVALGVMAVLARLLTPEDYGLIGMVFAFTAFVQVFSDLGLTMATVQKRELTGRQISTIYLLRMGLLDGWPGFRYCRLMAWYEKMIAEHLRAKRAIPSW